ncbi:hypothetical protein [Leisingera thetidis]|uniref:hypothetical protein n=1 Tax=Leisingera thetidis TaxID=2930199 RepID=UPI0021F6F2C0|nr:hypothetical protein [Leisingera thetidis]
MPDKTNTDLSELLHKQDGGNFLRAVAVAVLQLIMETDVEGLTGVGKHEQLISARPGGTGFSRAIETMKGTRDVILHKAGNRRWPTAWRAAACRQYCISQPHA